MQDQENLKSDESLDRADLEFEAGLRSLTPTALERSAGQIYVRSMVERERRRTRVWQGIAAMLLVGVAAAIWLRPAPQVVDRTVERVVYVDRPKDSPRQANGKEHDDQWTAVGLEQAGRFAYLEMRSRVLKEGVESLKGAGMSAGPAQGVRPAQSAPADSSELPWYVTLLASGGRS